MRTLSSALVITLVLLNGTALIATDNLEKDWEVVDRKAHVPNQQPQEPTLEELLAQVEEADKTLAKYKEQEEKQKEDEKINRLKDILKQKQEEIAVLTAKLNIKQEEPAPAPQEDVNNNNNDIQPVPVGVAPNPEPDKDEEQEEEEVQHAVPDLEPVKNENEEEKAAAPITNQPLSQPQQPQVGWTDSSHTKWVKNDDKSDWVNLRNDVRGKVNKLLKKKKK